MARVEVYTTPSCPFCVRAKRLLEARGIPFGEIDVAGDEALRVDIVRRTGRRTVPQIFIDGHPIGGYEELAVMDARGGPDVVPPPRVLVMAKHPVPGLVKTRLAARIGTTAAAALQAAFLRDLGARLAVTGLAVTWAVTPPDAPFHTIVAGAHTIAQIPGDLGARMTHAIGALFAAGPAPVVTLGSDVPHLDPGALAEATVALAGGADCVLGPARDGGYYLIALRAPAPALFAGVAWGSDRVLEETRARAAACGLRLHLLAPTFDVDSWDDLRALRALLAAGLVALPATAGVLAALPDEP